MVARHPIKRKKPSPAPQLRPFLETDSLDSSLLKPCGCRQLPMHDAASPSACENCHELLDVICHDTLRWFFSNLHVPEKSAGVTGDADDELILADAEGMVQIMS